ncbi:MAG: Type 1 glutamine amidotransferase-like domain-containing protein, partial [Gaiellaceae bacterium]
LNRFLLGLSGRERPRACFVPTATGDSPDAIVLFYEDFPASLCEPSHLTLFGVPRAGIREHLLAQDVIVVAGGNTGNMLAVWRVHAVDAVLREAWEAGVVLTGWSAGGICWFEGAVTDSFGPDLAPLDDGLGFLTGSFCPHYDTEAERRSTYHRLVSEGLPGGLAADDAVGLHFAGTELAEAVTERSGAQAYRVEAGDDGTARETPLPVRVLT